MVILGIETATSVLSVAILNENKILAEYSTATSRNHSSLLLPAIEEQLKKVNLKLSDINLIAISKGPGSFTGLRVGISLAKGLAFSLDIPLIGVPTLDALAKRIINGDSPGHPAKLGRGTVPIYNFFICPMLDAKKNQIYSALYKFENNEIKLLTEYLTIEFDNLCNLIEKIVTHFIGTVPYGDSPYKVLFTGESLEIYKSKLKERFKNSASAILSAIFASNQQSASAISVAKIGIEKFKKGEIDSVYNLVPLYIRKPDVREN